MKARLQTFLAWTALSGLMLVLAVRMTLLEVTIRTVPHVSAGHGGQSLSTLHFPGPAEIVGAGVVTVALTGLALIAAGKIRKVAWLLLALIVAILALAVAGTFHAANRFAALVGVFDAGMDLLAGWAMFILCNTDRRRQWVVVVMVGFLTMLCVKGFYQRYVEIPETMHFFFKHEVQYARQMGWKLNSPEMRLYISRLNSQEVTGFFDLSDAFAEGDGRAHGGKPQGRNKQHQAQNQHKTTLHILHHIPIYTPPHRADRQPLPPGPNLCSSSFK